MSDATPARPRWRPRFSLLTLVLGVIFIGGCGGLWWRWAPWHQSGQLPLTDASTDSDAVVLLKRSEGLYEIHDFEEGVSRPPFRLDPKLEISFLSTRDDRLLCESPDSVLSVHELPSGKRILSQPAPSLDRDHLIASRWLGDGGSVVLMHLDVIARMSETRDDLQSPELVAWDMNNGAWLYRLRLPGLFSTEAFPEAELYMRWSGSGLHFLPTTSPQHVWLQLSSTTTAESSFALNYLLETRSGRVVYSGQGDVPSESPLYLQAGEPVTLELCDALRPEYLKRFDLSPAKRRPLFTWLSPDRSRLFVMTGESLLFDVASGKVVARRSGRSGHSVVWDPSSTVFASYNPVIVRDGRSCGLVCQLGDDGVDARWVRFMEDHRRLLTEGDGTLIWDARKGTLLWWFPGLSSPIRYVSKAGDRVVTSKGEIWTRRRPEWWWGIAWLPEFWIAYFSGGALLVIAARRLRTRKAVKQEAA